MPVRQHDLRQLGGRPPELAKVREHVARVVVEERVDERQPVRVLEQERVDAAALLLADAVDALSQQHAELGPSVELDSRFLEQPVAGQLPERDRLVRLEVAA